MCVKKCPFKAIKIINLPKGLESQVTHRYGRNAFKLHRLPIPRANEVLGLVGQNGTGKSTALRILGGQEKPNLGKYDDEPSWKEVLTHFRGSELQNFFKRQIDDDLKTITKIQFVDKIGKDPRINKAIVGKLLKHKD